MKLSEYLLDRIFSLICMLVAALVLLALLWLIETPAVFILFAEVILLAAYSTALLYDFFRKQSFYNLLQKMTEQMDIKTLLGELLVPPHFLEGQILVDVLRCCNKYQNDQLACAEQENREYREYLDSWVHDLNVLSNVSVDGDSDIAAYLAAHDITISNYAKVTEQISVYEADMTYSELFEGQKVKFWPIDEKVPDSKVSVISISDLNRALAMQNKAPITLNDGQYLLNCNYNGTYRYVAAALQSHPEITVGGATLQRAEDKVLQETYIMTSVGNNDRGTLIVPDSVTASLEKDVNALLVQYKPDADSNEVLQKMIPIGLDSTHGYRYAEKNMMYETFYGLDALVSFLCCYIGLVFLLICAALLALKQLTETTDNVYRYGLLQKLGAGHRQINHTLFVQTVVFFAIPLVVAGVYSAFLIGKAMAVVEEFMNIHIATNIGLTIVLFLLVYGSYFFATYLSCKRIVTEQRELEV